VDRAGHSHDAILRVRTAGLARINEPDREEPLPRQLRERFVKLLRAIDAHEMLAGVISGCAQQDRQREIRGVLAFDRGDRGHDDTIESAQTSGLLGAPGTLHKTWLVEHAFMSLRQKRLCLL